MTTKRSTLAASIEPLPVVVEAAGRRFVIPVLPASSWILALMDDEPVTAVLPGLLSDESYESFVDLMVEEKIDLPEIRKMSFQAIFEVSGFKWWEALSLIGMCDGNPSVIGEMTLRGIDPDTIPFGRWCVALYTLAIRGLDEKERQKWIAKFSFPPPLAVAMNEAEEADSFEDMVRGFRGMTGVRGG